MSVAGSRNTLQRRPTAENLEPTAQSLDQAEAGGHVASSSASTRANRLLNDLAKTLNGFSVTVLAGGMSTLEMIRKNGLRLSVITGSTFNDLAKPLLKGFSVTVLAGGMSTLEMIRKNWLRLSVITGSTLSAYAAISYLGDGDFLKMTLPELKTFVFCTITFSVCALCTILVSIDSLFKASVGHSLFSPSNPLFSPSKSKVKTE